MFFYKKISNPFIPKHSTPPTGKLTVIFTSFYKISPHQWICFEKKCVTFGKITNYAQSITK